MQTLGGHKKRNLVPTRSQERGAVFPQETASDLSVSVQRSPGDMWIIVWPQAKQQGGNTVPSFNQKIGLKIYLKISSVAPLSVRSLLTGPLGEEE